MTIWSRASYEWRTYRAPKPRVELAPVGQRPSEQYQWSNGILFEGQNRPEQHCKLCGYHLCGCKPVAPAQIPTPAKHPRAAEVERQLRAGAVYSARLDHTEYNYRWTNGRLHLKNSFYGWKPVFVGFTVSDMCHLDDVRIVEPAPSTDFTGDLDWHQAKAAMVAGHTVVSTEPVDTLCPLRWKHEPKSNEFMRACPAGWTLSADFNQETPPHDGRYRITSGEP